MTFASSWNLHALFCVNPEGKQSFLGASETNSQKKLPGNLLAEDSLDPTTYDLSYEATLTRIIVIIQCLNSNLDGNPEHLGH